MKREYLAAGAIALLAAYFVMNKGGQSPLGSGGGLGSESGLPGIPGSGGGGADSPTVNIDFPELPAPSVFFENTKKEEAVTSSKNYSLEEIWNKAIERGYTYNPESGMLEKQLSENVKGHYAKSSAGFSGSWDEPTKKENEITSVWDLRLFGKTREQQMTIAPSLFQKSAPRTESFSSSSKLFVNKSPTPVQWSTSGLTKKERSTSSSSGYGSSTYPTRITPKSTGSAGGPMVDFINSQGRFF